MSIPVFSSTAATEDIADALGEAGCVVVTGVFDETARMRSQARAGSLYGACTC